MHNFKFNGKYIIDGQINCLTGLHIGGSSGGIEIGGLDNPVIKDPLTEHPYIPGSSLKGKLRSLLEWKLGKIVYNDTHKGCVAYDGSEGVSEVCKLFGLNSNDEDLRQEAGPTRLTVRDAFPTDDTLEKWLTWLGEGIYTEIKTENTLDRVTAEANPRPIERVPRDSTFNFQMIMDVYRPDDNALLKSLLSAMQLLEHSALGGSGSRGHGQISFKAINIKWQPISFYTTGKKDTVEKIAHEDSIAALLEAFDTFNWPTHNG